MNGLKKAVSLGVLGCAIALPAASYAQTYGEEDYGWYVSGTVNRLSADFKDRSDVSFDDSDNAAGARVGYMFTDLLGVELGYLDLGSYSAQGDRPGNDINLDADAFTGAVVLNFSVTPMLDLYGKFGAFYVDSDSTTHINGTTFIDSDDGVEPFGGIGIEADFGRFAVFGEYSRVDTSVHDLTLDIATVGVKYEFGY